MSKILSLVGAILWFPVSLILPKPAPRKIKYPVQAPSRKERYADREWIS